MAQTTVNLVGCLQSSNNLSRLKTSDLEVVQSLGQETDPIAARLALNPQTSPVEAANRRDVHLRYADMTSGEDDSGAGEAVFADDKGSTKKRTWRQMHRAVEQMDDEPICIIAFKWILIVVGATMLGTVIVIMSEVIYSWSSGELAAHHVRWLKNITSQDNKNLSSLLPDWTKLKIYKTKQNKTHLLKFEGNSNEILNGKWRRLEEQESLRIAVFSNKGGRMFILVFNLVFHKNVQLLEKSRHRGEVVALIFFWPH